MAGGRLAVAVGGADGKGRRFVILFIYFACVLQVSELAPAVIVSG